MYAIVRTGGKQYKVSEGDVVKVEYLEGEPGAEVTIDDILMVGKEDDTVIGTPKVDNAKVIGEIVEQGKNKKILVSTYKKRKGFEKRKGHRQMFTRLKIKQIVA